MIKLVYKSVCVQAYKIVFCFILLAEHVDGYFDEVAILTELVGLGQLFIAFWMKWMTQDKLKIRKITYLAAMLFSSLLRKLTDFTK